MSPGHSVSMLFEKNSEAQLWSLSVRIETQPWNTFKSSISPPFFNCWCNVQIKMITISLIISQNMQTNHVNHSHRFIDILNLSPLIYVLSQRADSTEVKLAVTVWTNHLRLLLKASRFSSQLLTKRCWVVWSLCCFLPTPPTAARPVGSRVNSREKQPQQVAFPWLAQTLLILEQKQTCAILQTLAFRWAHGRLHMLPRSPADKITADDAGLHTDDGKHPTMELRRILKAAMCGVEMFASFVLTSCLPEQNEPTFSPKQLLRQQGATLNKACCPRAPSAPFAAIQTECEERVGVTALPGVVHTVLLCWTQQRPKIWLMHLLKWRSNSSITGAYWCWCVTPWLCN